MNISIFVPEQAAIEAISPPYRLFTSANQFLSAAGLTPKFNVSFVGLSPSVKAQDGEYEVKMHYTIDEVKKTDLVIIPALYGDLTLAIEKNKRAIPWIASMYRHGAEIASLCLGAFLLAETGLANGKQCSTHWAYCDMFRASYPQVEMVDGAIISDSDGLYSSGGANSIWNLLLYLLEKYTNRGFAIQASKFFAIDIDRFDQSMFTIFNGQKAHKDPEILKTQEIIESRYAEKLTVDVLADYIAVNRRSFERRFKNATNNTVVEYLQRVRVEAAKRHFESGRLNVNEVMYEVGYADTKAFRDVFKRYVGLSPLEYRKKFAMAG
ncbi:MAG: helix-turn-helix domain-containing protein [Saprospiraceae bacterium]|nr:helix-turn-helix domain-containing protein [Saprospiraceae bacterium]